MYHNSFPASHLPLPQLRRKLALFGAVVPRRALPATRVPAWAPGPNWVRLAHLSLVPPGPAGIGFVLHNRPQPGPRLPVRGGKLGLFRRIGIGLEWWNTGLLGLPTAAMAGIGFVLHVLSSEATADRRNWVRLHFAPSSPPLRPRPARRSRKLGLFCRGLSNVLFTITPFPQTTCPSFFRGPNWVCLAQKPHVPRPSGPVPPGRARNWLRFAHFVLAPRRKGRKEDRTDNLVEPWRSWRLCARHISNHQS